jgi:heptosyltransferase-2
VKKFLIIQTAFIGDVVLATPLIEKLRQHYPEAAIDFLLRKGNETLLAGHPYLRQVLVFDKKEHKQRNLFAIIRNIRREKYDYVINLQRFLTTGIITAFSGGKHTIGFDKNPLSFLFTTKVPHVISSNGSGQHEVVRNLSLINSITDDGFVRPRLYPSRKDAEKVKADVPYVCMAPASVWFTKQWPESKWIALINGMPQGYHIYLLGAKGDMALCESIRSKASGKNAITILAGALSFLESAALMERAYMNFVNDSAPLHFASAVNAPVTALYCSTVPAFGFGPLSDRSFVFETDQPLSCRPCGLHGYAACPKGHFNCADIDVSSIIQTVFEGATDKH